MSDSTGKKAALHRRVLARLGIGTAIVAVAAKGAVAMKPTGTKAGAHYQETDHVKQYYRVNRY
jgi:hypothetical protein